jgi:glycosyltransferase involved in cell wall biosynthesis
LKILFINKYDTIGGAGIAALRLSKGLENKFQTDNYFLVGIKNSGAPNVYVTRSPGFQNMVERGVNYLSNLAGLQFQWFPFSPSNILKKALELKPDVISLHNIHGGYFSISLLSELSRIAPLFWTLHDMWAFTASAAHTYGDESWKSLKAGKDEYKFYPPLGINTGNWLLKKKQKIYNNSEFSVITPSKWLHDLAVQSPLLKNKKIVHINNGIDLNIFKPHDRNLTRKELNIPLDAKVLVFGAEYASGTVYKGGEDLIRILHQINQSGEKFHLLIIGKGDLSSFNNFSNLKLHQTGYLNSEELMSKYLAAADLMIYPTKADNLPNALVEAIGCGTPAVTYDIGGCGEIILNDFNGFVIEPFNTDKFASAVINIFSSPDLLINFKNNSLSHSKKYFNLNSMAEDYYRLFYS